MIDLSKVQFLAAVLVHEADLDFLYTKKDLAHLSHLSMSVGPTTIGEEHALIADVGIHFKEWSFSDHRPATHPAELMPAEIRIDFLQDQERKLTGMVEVSFEGRVILTRQLNYIRGW